MGGYVDEIKLWISVALIGILIAILAWIGGSYMEARAFNKFSNKKATITDAMFADLRIFNK